MTRTRRNHVALSLLLDWLTPLLLLAAALPIALYRLGAQSLWLDEGTTQWYVTSHHVGTLLLDLVRPTAAYPLYHLLVKAVTRLWGDSETVLRLPSALAYACGAPALYLLGRELRGRVAGLLAAALLLIAPWGLWQAQDAKAYSLALLTTILLVFLFARALRLGTRRAWIAWGIVALVAPFVHRLLLFSILGCGACWAVYRPRARRWPALLAIAVVALLLLGAIAGSLAYQNAGGQFARVGPLQAVARTFARFSVGQERGDVPLVWLVPFALLALLGLLRCARDLRRVAASQGAASPEVTRNARGATVLLLAGGLPLVLFLLLLSVQTLYEARYLIGVFPFWLLLLVWGVVPDRPPVAGRRTFHPSSFILHPSFIGGLLLVGALVVEQRALVQPGKGIFSGAPVKEQYRDAVQYLAQHVHPDDLVIVHPNAVIPLYNYYAGRMSKQPLPEPVGFTPLFQSKGFGVKELDSLIRPLLASKKRAWLLIAPAHASLVDHPPTKADDVGWVGLAFQYGEQEGRIQCGVPPYQGFVGVRVYCNNIPEVAGKAPEPKVKLEATFANQLRLRGYTVTPFPGGSKPGGTLPVTLFWEPLRDLSGTNYLVFVHLTRVDDPRPLAQTDGPPMEGGQPTSRWSEPHALLHDDRTIALPAELPPGRYALRMGVFRAEDATRLHVETRAPTLDDAVVLGEVRIAAP